MTGADSGIGLAFCHHLASKGMNLVMVSNRDKPLTEAALAVGRQYGVQTRPLQLDLCRTEAAPTLMQYLEENWVEPYILINNAGIFNFRELCRTSRERVNAFVDLHVRAVTELSRLMALRMMKAGAGYILNMSSLSCWTPMPGIALYAATKAYIRVLSRALAYEVRKAGVRVMVACPGGIATDLFGLPENLKRLAVKIGAIYTPERFVRIAVKKLLQGRKQYINGFINRLTIFLVGIAPTSVRMLVKTRMLDRGISR